MPVTSAPTARPPHPTGSAPPRKVRSPLWARLCLALGLVLFIGSGIVVGTRLIIAAAAGNLHQQNLLGDAGAQEQQKHVTVNGAKTILLVGLDNRPGQDPTLPIRADSIILLHVPASHDRAYLVSIPRDTYVQIPADKATGYDGGHEKINAAFAFGSWHGGGTAGGVHLLAQTIENITGIVPNAAAIIDFTGFQQVVQVLHGVYMCIDEQTTSIHVGVTADGQHKPPFHINPDGSVGRPIRGVTPVVYKKGCQHLSAWQALDYVRQRDLLELHDLDYGRQRHQQQFLKAVFKEIFSAGTLTNVTKLRGVISAMNKSMTVDTGGISPEDWVYAMRALTPDNVITIKTNAGKTNTTVINGTDYEMLSPTSMQLLQSLRDDTVDSFIAQHQDWVSSG